MKDVFGVVGNHRVACVVASLATSNDVGRFGEVVDNFTFSLVAPLEAANDGVHISRNSCWRAARG